MTQNSQHAWKSPSFEGLTPSPLDWARLAAYIDGEGSILFNTQKPAKEHWNPGWYLRVTVANTDVRLPVWLKETFGGSYKDANTPAYYVGHNWKRCYHWGCSSDRGAWLLHNCLPFFIMKSAQAELGMQLQESLAQTRKARRVGVPKEIVDYRQGLKNKLSVLKAKGTSQEKENELAITG